MNFSIDMVDKMIEKAPVNRDAAQRVTITRRPSGVLIEKAEPPSGVTPKKKAPQKPTETPMKGVVDTKEKDDADQT